MLCTWGCQTAGRITVAIRKGDCGVPTIPRPPLANADTPNNLRASVTTRWNHRAPSSTSAFLSRGQQRHERLVQRYAEQLGSDAQEAPPSDAELLNTECEGVLGEALERLPLPYHDVVAWHFFEKRTWEDIGQHLGCTERHARRLGEQALAILRGMLEGRV